MTQRTFQSSIFQSNNNLEMQSLITKLTENLTSLDDDLVAERLLSRQLKLSLDEATKFLEETKQAYAIEINELNKRIDTLESLVEKIDEKAKETNE